MAVGGEPYRFRYRTPPGSVVTEVPVGDRITRPVRAGSAATEVPVVVRDSDTTALDSSTIGCPDRRMFILTVRHNGTFTPAVSVC